LERTTWDLQTQRPYFGRKSAKCNGLSPFSQLEEACRIPEAHEGGVRSQHTFLSSKKVPQNASQNAEREVKRRKKEEEKEKK
jgi:hypothetical protein